MRSAANHAPTRLLARPNLAWLGAGFGLCYFSSFGQTFFIALFAKDVTAIGGLSHGGYGALYSVASLLSGFTMLWLGAQIDRSDLRRFCMGAVAGLAAACLLMAAAAHVLMLLLAIFGLRLFGQGLMSHAAMTTVARHLGSFRGRGIALAALGFSAGEASLPFLTVQLQDVLGWRLVWAGAGVLLLAVLLPLLLLLLPAGGSRPGHGQGPVRPALWLLRERRFGLILPLVLTPPFIGTGIFFHQVALVEAKGWSLGQFATAFVAYAATSVTASLGAGWLVDRLGAIRLLPWLVLPLTAACLVLGSGDHPAVMYQFMALAACTMGASATVTTSGWAELYGLGSLGSVRALATSATILAAAAGPGVFGLLLDAGVPFSAILYGCAAFGVAASLLAWWGMRGSRRQA
jgi:predicted MFS family arabinose efflux permease